MSLRCVHLLHHSLCTLLLCFFLLLLELLLLVFFHHFHYYSFFFFFNSIFFITFFLYITHTLWLFLLFFKKKFYLHNETRRYRCTVCNNDPGHHRWHIFFSKQSAENAKTYTENILLKHTGTKFPRALGKSRKEQI